MPYRQKGAVVFVLKNNVWVVLKKHTSAGKARKHLIALKINVKK